MNVGILVDKVMTKIRHTAILKFKAIFVHLS